MTNGPLLITTSTFPLGPNDSTPRFVWDLARHLTPYFPEVHILAPGHANCAAEEERDKVLIHRFTYFLPRQWQALCYGSGISQNLRTAPWLWMQVPFFVAAQLRATANICRRHHISLVNSHWLVFQGLTAGLLRKRYDFRHVCHVHAAELYALMRLPNPLGRTIGRIVIRRCDLVVCESSHVRSCLELLVAIPFKAQISCMGVDAELFAPEHVPHDMNRKKRILFVGRLVEKKGVEFLIRAMALLKSRSRDASLTVVGGGNLDASLRGLAADLKLTETTVQFVGPLPHEKIVDLLRQCDVFVVPSIVDSRGETEGMPTVILEAMAAGKKIVASRVNGIPDVLKDGTNGWLVEPANPLELAKAIEHALSAPHDNVVNAAIQTARYYSWPALANRYARWLTDVRPPQGRATSQRT